MVFTTLDRADLRPKVKQEVLSFQTGLDKTGPQKTAQGDGFNARKSSQFVDLTDMGGVVFDGGICRPGPYVQKSGFSGYSIISG
jgi:hypothetical protein